MEIHYLKPSEACHYRGKKKKKRKLICLDRGCCSHSVYLVDSLPHYVIIKWKNIRVVKYVAFQGFK